MTRGEALINRAKISRKSKDTIEDYQNEQSEWADKKSRWSGWGRLGGALALGGLAWATGGSSLLIAAAAGVGSRGGSEAGENMADRGNIWGNKDKKGKGLKPKELNKDDVTFYRNEADQINRDTVKFERDFDMNQNIDAAKDAYTAYNIANVAQSYGGEASREAAKAGGEEIGKDVARVAAQSPKEGALSMFKDTKAGVGKLFSRGGAKGAVENNFIKSVASSDINSNVYAGGGVSISVDEILSQGAGANYMDTFETMITAGYNWDDKIGWYI